jgi:hypothetical protein
MAPLTGLCVALSWTPTVFMSEQRISLVRACLVLTAMISFLTCGALKISEDHKGAICLQILRSPDAAHVKWQGRGRAAPTRVSSCRLAVLFAYSVVQRRG